MKYFSMFSGIGGLVNYISIQCLKNNMANRYTKQKIDLVLAKKLYESGMTQSEVAKELGTTQKVIWQRFKNDGYACRVAKKRDQFGKNNDSWKGNDAGYKALHYRVITKRGQPQLCEDCGTTKAKRYEWANLTGRFEDVNDYKRLCKSCHAKLDEIYKNFSMGGDAK